MPEISDSELRMFVAYQSIGTPDEVRRKISDLEKDNKTQRDELRDVKGKVPSDGQVVVTQEDADRLAAFKELGDPEVLKNRLREGEDAKARARDLEVREAAKSFAKAAGLADEAVDTLVAIPVLKDATFEVRTRKERNDKGVEVEVEVPYITMAGEDAKAMSFTDAQGKVPALKGLRTAAPVKSTRTVDFVQQGTQESGGGGSDNVFDRIRAERKAANEKAVERNTKVKSLEERLGSR